METDRSSFLVFLFFGASILFFGMFCHMITTTYTQDCFDSLSSPHMLVPNDAEAVVFAILWIVSAFGIPLILFLLKANEKLIVWLSFIVLLSALFILQLPFTFLFLAPYTYGQNAILFLNLIPAIPTLMVGLLSPSAIRLMNIDLKVGKVLVFMSTLAASFSWFFHPFIRDFFVAEFLAITLFFLAPGVILPPIFFFFFYEPILSARWKILFEKSSDPFSRFLRRVGHVAGSFSTELQIHFISTAIVSFVSGYLLKTIDMPQHVRLIAIPILGMADYFSKRILLPSRLRRRSYISLSFTFSFIIASIVSIALLQASLSGRFLTLLILNILVIDLGATYTFIGFQGHLRKEA